MLRPPLMQGLFESVQDDPKCGEANLACAVRLTRQPTMRRATQLPPPEQPKDWLAEVRLARPLAAR